MQTFISPVADDPVTRLQYLLQNTLYSYIDIVMTFSPGIADQFSAELSKEGITLPITAKKDINADSSGEYTTLDLQSSISDRVARLRELNDQIQAAVDLLPDSSISRDDSMAVIKVLNEECEKASAELMKLYAAYDEAYKLIEKKLEKETDT